MESHYIPGRMEQPSKGRRAIYFKTTRNSLILRAVDGNNQALNELAELYRPPILNFIRQHGFGDEDAEDLVQNTLMRLLSPLFLKQKLDFSKGKFRSFLLGMAKNIMREEWKRRGRAKFASMEDLEESLSAPEAEKNFDRDWCHQLFSLAMEALRKDDETAHRVLLMRLEGRPYTDITAATGLKQTDIANRIRKAKMLLAAEVERRVGDYALNETDFEQELKFIRSTLDAKGQSR